MIRRRLLPLLLLAVLPLESCMRSGGAATPTLPALELDWFGTMGHPWGPPVVLRPARLAPW